MDTQENQGNSNGNGNGVGPESDGLPADVPPPKPPGQPLSDFLLNLEDFTPTMPDSVTLHYLNSSGFESCDPRVVRLISLAAQKFISDVVNDALHHNKIRLAGGVAKKGTKDKKMVLSMEDLAPSLEEYGIKAKKPHYFN